MGGESLKQHNFISNKSKHNKQYFQTVLNMYSLLKKKCQTIRQKIDHKINWNLFFITLKQLPNYQSYFYNSRIKLDIQLRN